MEDKLQAARAARRTARIGIASGVLMFAYGLWVSRTHITEIGHWLELSRFEAETLFVLVDFLALYGKLLTSGRLSAKTRRYGFKVMMIGLALSTACNIGSGVIANRVGAAAYGLFLVVIIVLVEYGVSITKAKAAQAPRTPKAPPAARAPRKRTPRAVPVSPATVNEINEAMAS